MNAINWVSHDNVFMQLSITEGYQSSESLVLTMSRGLLFSDTNLQSPCVRFFLHCNLFWKPLMNVSWIVIKVITVLWISKVIFFLIAVIYFLITGLHLLLDCSHLLHYCRHAILVDLMLHLSFCQQCLLGPVYIIQIHMVLQKRWDVFWTTWNPWYIMLTLSCSEITQFWI